MKGDTVGIHGGATDPANRGKNSPMADAAKLHVGWRD
jgi:hypothetical protein